MSLFNFLPEKTWGVLFVILLNIIIQLGLSAFNKIKTKQANHKNNELANIMFGSISLIYSLLIAFVIIAVWQDYEELNQTVEKETDNLNSLVIHTKIMPDSLKRSVYHALDNYCHDAIGKEWGTSENTISLRTRSAITNLRILLLRTTLRDPTQRAVVSTLDEHMSALSDLRRQRLSHTRSHVPQLIWSMIIFSSVLMIVFSFFLYTESMPFKRTCLLFLGTMIGICLFLVFMLDHPFTGSSQIDKLPYHTIISLIRIYER